MAELYTYAVARIRAKELSLLSSQDIEQLVSAKDAHEVLQLLADKGFDGGGAEGIDEILEGESNKTWELMGELLDDMSVLDVFLFEKDFHNLKAAVKAVYSKMPTDGVFMPGGTAAAEEIYEAVRDREFGHLPENMRAAAAEAVQMLNKTGDGQLCDIIIDKAALEAIRAAGRASGNDMIDKYSELTAALADIKIAYRGARLKKSADFLRAAIAECDTLSKDKLVSAAIAGTDELFSYLELTDYAPAVTEIKESDSDFEKWCDNLIMDFIRKQKSNPFTIAPLAAYVLARENEIKAVRIILTAKENGLSESFVRERLRDMYV